MRILSSFLNDLIKMPEILNSKYFESFLSIKDPNKLEKFKSEVTIFQYRLTKKLHFRTLGQYKLKLVLSK